MGEIMVRVDQQTTDQIAGWRVRDALAAHPLLGGATAQIHIVADYECIILCGWALDEEVIQLAERMARRVAGKRSVQADLLRCRRAANKALTERILDGNNLQALH